MREVNFGSSDCAISVGHSRKGQLLFAFLTISMGVGADLGFANAADGGRYQYARDKSNQEVLDHVIEGGRFCWLGVQFQRVYRSRVPEQICFDSSDLSDEQRDSVIKELLLVTPPPGNSIHTRMRGIESGKRDVRDFRGPDLIGTVDHLAAQEVFVGRVLPIASGGLGPLIPRLDAHQGHQSLRFSTCRTMSLFGPTGLMCTQKWTWVTGGTA